jgi:hypothetical protein
MPATCGFDGTCDGQGGCRFHIEGTECRAGFCTMAKATPVATCNEMGRCGTGQPVEAIPCAPYICGARACTVECRRRDDCEAPNNCISNKCVSDNAAIVNRTISVPLIDGQRDAVWGGAEDFEIRNLVEGSVMGAQDLSASFRVLWNNEALFILFEVRDDEIKNDSPEVWKDDSVEVYLDADLSQKTTYDGVNDTQYLFGFGDLQVQETKLGRVQNVEFATRATDGGYVVEIRIPWTTIGVAPKPNLRFGFEVSVNDDDASGGERDAKIMWFGTKDEAFTRPAAFGQAVLSQ